MDSKFQALALGPSTTVMLMHPKKCVTARLLIEPHAMASWPGISQDTHYSMSHIFTGGKIRRDATNRLSSLVETPSRTSIRPMPLKSMAHPREIDELSCQRECEH